MKRVLSLLVIFTMICTLCPMFPLSSVMTAEAANQTYYYGFEDGKLPEEMSLTYCKNPTYTNGIFSFTPQNMDPMITFNKTFTGDEVNLMKIRMYHNLVARDDGLHQIQVYYKGTNASGNYLSGTTDKLSEGNSVKQKIELSSDGKFITYTIDFSTMSNWAGSTITQLRIDPVSCNSVDGDTVKIDYIMLCKKADDLDPILSYEFETDGDYEGFVPYSALKSCTSVSDGCLNYSNTDGSDYDISYALSGLSAETNTYEYIEVMMAHDISVSGKTSDLLKIYIEATLADGTVNTISRDSDTIKNTITATSNGEYKRYVFPLTELSDGTSLLGATITKIRIDPINNFGSASIDSIRFVPHYVQYEPLDADKMTLSYTFDNNDAGCAKGTIKMDFDGQNPLFAKNVELIWASGNATDGYTALDGYSSITSKTGAQMAKGYVISRPLYIPEGTTALIARVTDSSKTFDLVVDIPSAKVLEKSEPKFVAALASDFHFGDAAVALTAPAQKYYDLQTHVQANADALLVVGDIVQWYGVRDRDEYYHLEYLSSGGTKYTDYAEYDSTALPSQWDMAMDYFQSWDIPVFIIEGNHETPSAGRVAQGHTGKYMKDWMTEWVNYANNQSMYDEFTVRDKYVYDNTYEYATYYDNYVTGADGTKYHVIGMRNLHMGNTKLSEQELQWLDKKLYENEATGTPTFLMIHVPLYGNFTSSTTFNDQNFKAVVDKHPNTVIVSGHTHYSLYSDYQLAINGEGDAPSWLHDGAVVDTGIHYPDEGVDGSYSKSNCELVYAEIYEDRIVTRAYDVVKGKYIATNTNQITLKDETAIDDISVTKTVSDGYATLTASCDTDNVTYQWYVGGEAAEAGASVTVPDSCTDFVAVRVTDSNGGFRSQSFDSIYDADITYDEGRTYFVSMGDADGGSFSISSGPDVIEWVDGAGGKSDEVYHISGTDEETGKTRRIYSQFQTWSKMNENSNYVVISYNAMPLNKDTYTVYLCTKSANNLSIRSPKMIPFKWNNMKVVVNLATSRAYTYVNGVLLGNVDASMFISSGQIRLSAASVNDNTYVPLLDAYIDDMEIYETVNAPVIMPVSDIICDEVNGSAIYAAENKIAYVPAGTTAGAMSKAFWCAVVDENGATKASDAVVADTDMLMYYDSVSASYIYYTVATYTDYSSIFVNGVTGSTMTSDNIKLYVNAKTAGNTAIIAQYDASGALVSADYTVCTAGLNEISFTKAADTDNVSVLVWSGINDITPLTKNVDLVK